VARFAQNEVHSPLQGNKRVDTWFYQASPQLPCPQLHREFRKMRFEFGTLCHDSGTPTRVKIHEIAVLHAPQEHII